jgi:hypothetical protein
VFRDTATAAGVPRVILMSPRTQRQHLHIILLMRIYTNTAALPSGVHDTDYRKVMEPDAAWP